ncbi:MAG: right-handed parallel beta-helix repeat-containing protein [candidate division KSB1 bacterium]|nr:right-handed parallel beta-helix repeat-containing protein [candidate division KSB1 bacterium]
MKTPVGRKIECFRFLLLLFVLSLACTRKLYQERTLTITGSAKLSGMVSHEGISVMLYSALPTDTTIANLQSRFPSLGVPAGQPVLFEPRLASPLYKTQTAADGFFKFDEVPEGNYNLVIEKKGYGRRILPNLDRSLQLEEVVLYPERRVTGELDFYTVWDSRRHIIVANDLTIPEGVTLLIDKGAVVRFEGYGKLIVYGKLVTIGTAEEPVIFTTDVLDQQNAGSWRGLEIFGEAELVSSVFDHADMAVNCRGGRVSIRQCIFRDINDRGVVIANEGYGEVSGSLFYKCKAAVQAETNSQLNAIGNLVTNPPGYWQNSLGMVSNSSRSMLTDNGITHCDVGCSIEFRGTADLLYNYIAECGIGVNVVSLVNERSRVTLQLNTIVACTKYSINILDNASPLIEKNNLLQLGSTLFIRAYSLKYPSYPDIIARNNYFGETAAEVKRRIEDRRVNMSGGSATWSILIDPVAASIFVDAYPRPRTQP